MFKFKDKANPVGVIHKMPEVEEKLVKYARMWDEQKARSFFGSKSDRSRLTHFMLMALDDFIMSVAILSIPGQDKKATVLDAMDRLYDYTVREAVPIWLRPFTDPIKQYLIYVLMSFAIDWAVQKYKNGNWGNVVETGALARIMKKAGCESLPCVRCRKGDA